MSTSAEFELIGALRPYLDGEQPGLSLGPGDDAAIVDVGTQPVAIAIDALVGGVHADLALSSWADVGWKAIARNVSDLAAVGATPVAAVVALQRPPGTPDADVVDLYDGIRAAADRWSLLAVGGDTVTAPTFAVTVAMIGRPPDTGALRRDGARPGDEVVVVGVLGEAAAGLALWRAGLHDLADRHPELLAAHRRPNALPHAGAVLAAAGATACIDVSDGLGRDLGHVARASHVRIELDASALPLSAGVAAVSERLGVDPLDLVVGGGDDYALAATLPAANRARLDASLAEAGLVALRIGAVEEGEGVVLRGAGVDRDVSDRGWEHGG